MPDSEDTIQATISTNTTKPTPRVWSLAERERMAELGLIADPSEPELRFDVEQFEKLFEQEFFLEERVFLVQGEVLTVSTPGEPHTNGITLVYLALQALFGSGYYVRNQGALELSQETIVIPDLAVIVGSPRTSTSRPTTALLLVEVSDSSFTFDVTVKAELYATAGIADYWVVDLASRRLLVFRDPAPLPDGGNAHRTQLIRYSNDTIAPLAMPTANLTVSDLLP